MSTTFDLFNLDLSAGTHSITAISKAGGYADSAESEAVSYEADELQGTWLLDYGVSSYGNGEIISVNGTFYNLSYSLKEIILSADRITFQNFYTANGPVEGTSYVMRTNSLGAPYYDLYEYRDEAYYLIARAKDDNLLVTITSKLAEVENGDILLAWLKANATKQEIKTDATVTITNTSTSHGANVGTSTSSFPIDSDIGTVDANSTKTFTIPKGTTIFISGNSGIIPYWESTSVTGDIVAENYIDGYIAPYTINGDGTIIGYAEDLD